jgi:glycosyltransferase involved in cell wall biosynthesis
MSADLDRGVIPSHFEEMVNLLVDALSPVLRSIDVLIVHNVFSKHFNLPLTAALFRLLEEGGIHHCVAWCHDLTWTSPRSQSKVYPAYPWDLLRTYRSDITYVTVSQERQRELTDLLGRPQEEIRVIYNGVDPGELLALDEEIRLLIDRLELWESDLNLIMPVRVTKAKNIELALRVVAELKQKKIGPKLVITGPPDPHDPANMGYFQSLLHLREQLRLIDQAHFVYESGPVPDEPYTVGMPVVASLMRISDALFMPSHQEGFGMPVLEAGLAGIPVFSAEQVPAAAEIGGPDVIRFSPAAEPVQIAELVLRTVGQSSVWNLRRRVRQTLTWRSIFDRQILPLVGERSHEVRG